MIAEKVGWLPIKVRTEYMTFVKVGQKPKTSEWHIVNNQSGYVLGSIHWYGAWRQYVVETYECTFNNKCLDTISEFLTKLNNEQSKRVAKPISPLV